MDKNDKEILVTMLLVFGGALILVPNIAMFITWHYEPEGARFSLVGIVAVVSGLYLNKRWTRGK